jgi:prolyl oligopeptidase
MRVVCGAAGLLLVLVVAACGAVKPGGADPFQLLEPVNSPQAARWVAQENQKTMNVLGKDPRYADNLAKAAVIGESPQRLARPEAIGGSVFTFWQDKDHVRGVWRATSAADYETGDPHWATVLDLDKVASDEGKNWVWKGADCSQDTPNRCLVEFSEGGEDAVTIREFDTGTRVFVPEGFVLPRGKQCASWQDDNALLVSANGVQGS